MFKHENDLFGAALTQQQPESKSIVSASINAERDWLDPLQCAYDLCDLLRVGDFGCRKIHLAHLTVKRLHFTMQLCGKVSRHFVQDALELWPQVRKINLKRALLKAITFPEGNLKRGCVHCRHKPFWLVSITQSSQKVGDEAAISDSRLKVRMHCDLIRVLCRHRYRLWTVKQVSELDGSDLTGVNVSRHGASVVVGNHPVYSSFSCGVCAFTVASRVCEGKVSALASHG